MKYKLSKYIVVSEPIISKEYRLIYSTISTSLIVSKVEDYAHLLNGDFGQLRSSLLERLKEMNIVIDENIDELKSIIDENKKVIANDKTLFQVISPSGNCQLGCDYCGQVHTKDVLTEDLSAKILKRVTNNITLKEYKTLVVGWFGAEPLMGLKNIRELSKEFKQLADDNGLKYAAQMVTNGLSLKRHIFYDLAENYSVRNFEITLDGTEKHHDVRRHTKLKQKTFALIFKNLKEIVNDERFKDTKAEIVVRCNVDESNYLSTFDLIDLLEKENILNNISFYTAPIHSWGNDAHLKSLSIDDYSKFQIEEFISLMNKNHEFVIVPGKKAHIVCTSLKENAEVFDAYGDVYNCTEISQVPAYENDDSFKVGKLYDESYSNKKRPYSDWNDDVLAKDFPCGDCRILPICGGACPKLWKEGISPCPPIKHNIEDRLLLEFYKNKDKYIIKKQSKNIKEAIVVE
jgi:uncharacterized protein